MKTIRRPLLTLLALTLPATAEPTPPPELPESLLISFSHPLPSIEGMGNATITFKPQLKEPGERISFNAAFHGLATPPELTEEQKKNNRISPYPRGPRLTLVPFQQESALEAFTTALKKFSASPAPNSPVEINTVNMVATLERVPDSSPPTIKFSRDRTSFHLKVEDLDHIIDVSEEIKTALDWLRGLDENFQQTKPNANQPSADRFFFTYTNEKITIDDHHLHLGLRHRIDNGKISDDSGFFLSVDKPWDKALQRRPDAPTHFNLFASREIGKQLELSLTHIAKKQTYKPPGDSVRYGYLAELSADPITRSATLTISTNSKQTTELKLDFETLKSYSKQFKEGHAMKEWLLSIQPKIVTLTNSGEKQQLSPLLDWTDNKGRTIQARLLKIHFDTLTLAKEDGTTFEFNARNLSDESQEQLRSIREKLMQRN